MAPPLPLPRALRPTSSICASCARLQTPRRLFTASHTFHLDESRLPRIAAPSLWSSLVPKPFRRKPADATAPAKERKPWNPYTSFIVLALLVGSNAIQLLALRNEMDAFSRKTNAKLELLREVVGKVRRGEIVDDEEVRRALGTGRAEEEREWEEVVREVESADVLADAERRREERKMEKMRARELRDAERKAREEEDRRSASPVAREAGEGVVREGRPKFLM